MICAIHQPNFFCWMPYFRKMQQADVFVILTECQFARDYYQHRFNIGDKWYTMPIEHGFAKIKDKRYKDAKSGYDAIKRRLPQYEKFLSKFDDCICNSLVKTNSQIIYRLCGMLGIDIEKIRFDFPTTLNSTGRLIEICKHYGCDEYLSGIGAKAYLDEDLFNSNGIKLRYQEIKHEDKKPIVEVLCR